jgi:serine/threonine-protein kinase
MLLFPESPMNEQQNQRRLAGGGVKTPPETSQTVDFLPSPSSSEQIATDFPATEPGVPATGDHQKPSPPLPAPGGETVDEVVAETGWDTAPPAPQQTGATIDYIAPPELGETVPPEQGVVLTPPRTSGEGSKPVSRAGEDFVPPGYEILGELGRGGMGVVYKARQVELDRVVALKMILAGAHAGEKERERFSAEARAVARIQHPNIVQLYEIGQHDGLPYFSLEFVDGGSLDRKIRRQPQPPREAARLVEVLARAMHYAHERGIVHRDLKPANVLLTRDGTPKISDFGLAKRLEEDSTATRSGMVLGTPSYMSPEQARGDVHHIGPHSDVYALGAILYDLLTGRPPFAGSSMLDTIEQVCSLEPLAPRTLQPGVPRDLETICLKCLQKEPQRRYASALELAEDLRRFESDEPILARPVPAWERLWRWCKRNPRVAGLSAAVLVLMAAISLGSFAAAWIIAEKKEQAVVAQQQEAAQRRLAEEAREKEAEERQRADRNAEVAGEQRRLALEALRTLVLRVQDRMQGRTELQPLRRGLLDVALAELQKVVKKADETELVDRSMAAARQRMGDIFFEAGRPRQALQEYEKMHAILDTLTRETPEDGVAVRNLAAAFNKMADAHLRLGNATKARECYQEGLRLRQKWVQLVPGHDPARLAVADSYGLLGNVSLLMGKPEEARAAFLASQKCYRELPDAALEGLQEQRLLASLDEKVGEAALKRGDEAEARKFHSQAWERRLALLKKHRGSSAVRWDLAVSQVHFGDVSLMLSGNPAQAVHHYQSALRGFEAFHKTDPDSVSTRRALALVHYRLGAACQRVGWMCPGLSSVPWTVAGQGQFEQSLALRQALALIDKDDTQAQIDLMLAQARCGRHAEAAKAAEALWQHSPQDTRVLFHVACGYALCAAATHDKDELNKKYLDESFAVLRQARQHGWKDPVALRTDPDLDPLRGHAAYHELLTETTRR